MNQYRDKAKEILDGIERYHQAFYQGPPPFGGPSLYFHKRALETRNMQSWPLHLEYVYATLASWGMHRMGQKGSKMKEFHIFCRSVDPLKDWIEVAQQFTPAEMDPPKWAILERIFQSMTVMDSRVRLVGHSKVMHHMMPNIVPPIDREYTLRFLRGSTTIKKSTGWEWDAMKTIISDFFIPITCDVDFDAAVKKWIGQDAYQWDTSPMKVIDNLVIGARKHPPRAF